MSEVKLYLDEDVNVHLARGLRLRGFDVVATDEVGRKSWSDRDQLDYACRQRRAIVTCNIRDFVKLHRACFEEEQSHCGIIVIPSISRWGNA